MVSRPTSSQMFRKLLSTVLYVGRSLTLSQRRPWCGRGGCSGFEAVDGLDFLGSGTETVSGAIP